jgi:hypothetical protein
MGFNAADRKAAAPTHIPVKLRLVIFAPELSAMRPPMSCGIPEAFRAILIRYILMAGVISSPA